MVTSPFSALWLIFVLQRGNPRLHYYFVFYQKFTQNPKSLWCLQNVDVLFLLILHFFELSFYMQSFLSSLMFISVQIYAFKLHSISCNLSLLVLFWWWNCPRMASGTPLSWSLCAFDMSPLFFKQFFFFDSSGCSRVTLFFSFSNPGISLPGTC